MLVVASGKGGVGKSTAAGKIFFIVVLSVVFLLFYNRYVNICVPEWFLDCIHLAAVTPDYKVLLQDNREVCFHASLPQPGIMYVATKLSVAKYIGFL